MIIRRLTLSDYNRFLPLIQDFRETQFTENEFKERLEMIEKNSEIFVMEDNNQLIATATIIYEYKFIFSLAILAHIEDVCVKKSISQRYKDKHFFFHFPPNQIKEKGCYKITLNCSDSNEDFYVKCGFKHTGNQMVKF